MSSNWLIQHALVAEAAGDFFSVEIFEEGPDVLTASAERSVVTITK